MNLLQMCVLFQQETEITYYIYDIQTGGSLITSRSTSCPWELKGDMVTLSEMRSKELNAIQDIVDGLTTSATCIDRALQKLTSVLDNAYTVKPEVYQRYRKERAIVLIQIPRP